MPTVAKSGLAATFQMGSMSTSGVTKSALMYFALWMLALSHIIPSLGPLPILALASLRASPMS